MLLGSVFDEDFRRRPAFKRKVPVFFGHGSHDIVFAIDKQQAFYRSLHAAKGGYPDALRALRNRYARHADPHGRLARDAQLDDVGGAIGCAVPCSTALCRDR